MNQQADRETTTQPGAQASTLFRSEGDYWVIAFEGQVVRLRDSRGLRYLSLLLHNPATPVAASTLVDAARTHPLSATASVAKAPEAPSGATDRERARISVSKAIKSAVERIAVVHPALAQHLQVTIHRGYVCNYVPDARVPVRWGS